MIGWTFCSGIGAPEMASPWVDWRLASEIENFPRAVLQDRYGYRLPEDHNQGEPLLWSDMTEVTPELARSRGVPLPDMLVAGTPCQAFSVAGLRKGTDDERGNLTLKFVETCHAIVDARLDGKLAVLWENVPGVLSDKGNAFGCFLGGLVGADDALSAPADGSWPGVGMVSGPRARAAWRVLDAQYFGVAQRRRRVFVVVDFGNCVDPATVLFERKGLQGHSAPSREAREGTASAAIQSANVCRQIAVGNVEGGQVATLSTREYKGLSCGRDGMTSGAVVESTSKASIIPDVAGTMISRASSGGFSNSIDHAAAGYMVPVSYPFDLNQITSKTNRSQPDPEVCHTVPASSCAPHLADPWAVRRLTPVECARLQGFPDDHTAITYRGKPAADGPQYKALGNSMAVPVIAWIMGRMRENMEAAA